mgnify:CR=1 FL=1
MKFIQVRGASENNLQGLSIDLPRNSLTVITGVSGSGKSSLAFNTIYKEGHRRFLESLSAYARRFLGGIDRPAIDSIEGLSPSVSIEQRTIQRNPRSTVGTMTEIYDHLRLLYARLGTPHCPGCSRVIDSQSAEQVAAQLLASCEGTRGLFCAPIIRDRRGAFGAVFDKLKRDGYRKVIVDGELTALQEDPPVLDPNAVHSVDVICDRLTVEVGRRPRIVEAIENCFHLAEDTFRFRGDPNSPHSAGTERLFSGRFSCPDCQVDLPSLDTRIFSYNLPFGRCPRCKGTGKALQIDPSLLVTNRTSPLLRGGLSLFSEDGKPVHLEFNPAIVTGLLKKIGRPVDAAWGDLESDDRKNLLYGQGQLPGLLDQLEEIRDSDEDAFAALTAESTCRECRGERLGALPRAVKFSGATIGSLCQLPIDELLVFFNTLQLDGPAAQIAPPLVSEISRRLSFLKEVGLGYLSLGRSAPSLAGGEVQRVRLAGQLGSALQGVIFVLDEPSIGLHSRDNRKLLGALEQLRDRGNTVIVVEHDQETIELADHVVDMGPGAGVEGGRIVAEGTAKEIMEVEASMTGAYLSGKKQVLRRRGRRAGWEKSLKLEGVTHNNLDDVNVEIPLERLVAVSGVSGSGKSSLINQVLYPALLRKSGSGKKAVGAHADILGHEFIDKILSVDQTPIGKSTRSNPATYTKLFSLIRELFARLPEAQSRGYKSSRFSFNVDGGRCIECRGAGVKSVDMQFLAPVEVACEACGGQRYNRETLEIRFRGKSISEVLDLTVGEALDIFSTVPRIDRTLRTLDRLGLSYLKLGQPATTLSGGEGQRLKLANELQKKSTGRTLYLLDEPTTGLHFDDVRVLIDALDELVSNGNSVVVIEHNLDVIQTADYVIDLGPEGGSEGGKVIAVGTPEELSQNARSYTGIALKARLDGGLPGLSGEPRLASGKTPDPGPREIKIQGAALNNLKSVDVAIPHQKLTVLTGVSGSGKSSLAFGTLFAEGQRRYLDSLSTYARHFLGNRNSPPVEQITGMAPAIAIDQKSGSGNSRSTVATMTEVHDHLRLLFAHIGQPHCPECEQELAWVTPSKLAEDLVNQNRERRLYILAPLVVDDTAEDALRRLILRLLKDGRTRILAGEEELRLDEGEDAALRRILNILRSCADGEPPRLFLVLDRMVVSESVQSRIAASIEACYAMAEGVVATRLDGGRIVRHSREPSCGDGHFTFSGTLSPRMFSYSSYEGACPSCGGAGKESRVLYDSLIAEPSKPLNLAVAPPLRAYLETFRPSALVGLDAVERHLGLQPDYATGDLHPDILRSLLYGLGDELIPLALKMGQHEITWAGLAAMLEGWLRGKDPNLKGQGLDSLFESRQCSACEGRRLKPESLAVRVANKGIHDLLSLSIADAESFFQNLVFSGRKQEIAGDVLRELSNRLRFLTDVGLGYLELSRNSNTLSGGEAQRIRLASQLGNRLTGAIYVLDEPTIGLHEWDTRSLLTSLQELKDAGNTVIVVEHDRHLIESADHLIDLGPGPGERGGEIVSSGTPADVAADKASLTGSYLRGDLQVFDGVERRSPSEDGIWLRGATLHNLKSLDVKFPHGILTAITGVSGSGKSTLVMKILAEAVRAHLRRESEFDHLSAVEGLDGVRRLVTVGQKPVGRSRRSTPATYAGAWDHVRALYARMPLAMARGYKVGRFSFNSSEGQCSSCEGQGACQVEMQFLSDIWVTCEECRGRRFNRATLEILFKGKNIAEILELEIQEACEFFANQPPIFRFLTSMNDVGLGYLKLGQSSPSLSTGEAQRVKLAAELAGDNTRGALYILDEPTTGLHFSEVKILLKILNRLVDGGGTVILIEHNMDLIKASDWVIDMGPGPGPRGGEIIYEGVPDGLQECPDSKTGKCLRL